jgi:hypothetical protein
MPDIDWDKIRRGRNEADARLRPYLDFLSLGQSGYYHQVPLARRVADATDAYSDQRNRSQSLQFRAHELALFIARLTADTLAGEILAAAGPDQDDATLRWIAAGLRCRYRPFCTGCESCHTVTSPGRSAERLTDSGGR